MKNFLRDGWDFGVFALLISLPIVAVLFYVFGAGVIEAFKNPAENRTTLVFVATFVAYFGVLLWMTAKVRSKQARAEEIDG